VILAEVLSQKQPSGFARRLFVINRNYLFDICFDRELGFTDYSFDQNNGP